MYYLLYKLTENLNLFVYSDLGVHVDGFISNVAHSFVVGVTKVGTSTSEITEPGFLEQAARNW